MTVSYTISCTSKWQDEKTALYSLEKLSISQCSLITVRIMLSNWDFLRGEGYVADYLADHHHNSHLLD